MINVYYITIHNLCFFCGYDDLIVWIFRLVEDLKMYVNLVIPQICRLMWANAAEFV